MISRFRGRRDERGATAVEYGLLVAMIAAVIVIAVVAFGGMTTGLFKDTCTGYSDSSGQQTDCDG